MNIFIKTPKLIQRLLSKLKWKIVTEEKLLYLTFDDGPTPEITSWVIEQLNKYKAKATFFCIGKNVVNHMELYHLLHKEGHSIGNHTHNHLNAWKTDSKSYISNIHLTESELYTSLKDPDYIKLFRPPYGKLTPKTIRQIQTMGYHIIMWDVLSVDYNTKLTPEKCWKNIKENAKPGSIIVFHDSIKAFPRLQYALPKTLAYFSEKGFTFKAITKNSF